MLTYQVRRRGLYTEPLGVELSFPSDVELVFRLSPESPFGRGQGVGYTAVTGHKARCHFNANTGRTVVEAPVALSPVNVSMKLENSELQVAGPEFTLRLYCESRAALQEVLETYFYILPILLNVDFYDSPVIVLVTARVGAVECSWGVVQPVEGIFDSTTTDRQEKRILAAIKRSALLDDRYKPGRRRLIAALHWFHVACRLARVGVSPWEFLSEILLNYAKILEVLFPGASGSGIDAARIGLRSLGFLDAEIEVRYIPTLALRNNVDVAHISLAVFNQEDLETLHEYASHAEEWFRDLLSRVLDKLAAGLIELPDYSDGTPKPAALTAIDRIRTAMGKNMKG